VVKGQGQDPQRLNYLLSQNVSSSWPAYHHRGCLLWPRLLTLYQLGEVEGARETLVMAVKNLRLVGKELMKKHHPRLKDMLPDSITFGGEDKAYLYRKVQGRYWEQTPGKLDLLREVLNDLPTQET
jgi:hypothetical protein